ETAQRSCRLPANHGNLAARAPFRKRMRRPPERFRTLPGNWRNNPPELRHARRLSGKKPDATAGLPEAVGNSVQGRGRPLVSRAKCRIFRMPPSLRLISEYGLNGCEGHGDFVARRTHGVMARYGNCGRR